MRRSIRIALLICGLPSGLACGSDLPDPVVADSERVAVAPPRVADGPALFPGEKLAVEILLRGLPAGQLVASVGPPCRAGERDAVPVRAMGRSTGVVAAFRDVWLDVTSLIDRRGGLVLQVRTHKKVRKPRLTEVELGEERFWWRRKRQGRPPTTGEQPLPPSTHDPLSLLGLLRRWRPAVSPEAQVHVLVERRVWRVQLMYRGVELLDTPAGEQPAVRVDGVAQKLKRDLQSSRAEPRAFSLWIADDRDRAPLRFVIETRQGELLAELADYERGDHSDDAARGWASAAAAANRTCPAVATVREAALKDAAESNDAAHQRGRAPAGRAPRVPVIKPFGP